MGNRASASQRDGVWRLALAPLVCMALLMACGKPSDKPTTPSTKPNLAQVGVKYDLAEYFPVAEIHGEVKRLVPGMPGSDRFFTAGWNKAEVTATSESFAWTTTRDAVVEVPRVRPEDFRIALDLMPQPPGPRLPPQHLTIAWNGDTVTSVTLSPGRQSVEINIPAARQHYGMNRLELLPGYWIRPSLLGMGNDSRDLGVRCFAINLLSSQTAEASHPKNPFTRAERGIIHQQPGTVVSYAFALPEHARVTGYLSVRLPADSKRKPKGRVVLALRAESSDAERRIADVPMESLIDSGMRIDADLGEVSGQMAAVTLSCWGQEPFSEASEAVEVEWKNFGIEGTREEPTGEGVGKLRGRYNILLVLFDSLRADDIEPYGSRNVKTPTLARLAAEGVTFVNARSNAAWTAPSVASLFTSKYPTEHGVKAFGSELAPGSECLAELLQHRGYRTMAILNSPIIDSTRALGEGFDREHKYFMLHDDKMRKEYRKPEDHAAFIWNQYISPQIDEAQDAPFFIYLHELDPHMPYVPMPPFDAIYGPIRGLPVHDPVFPRLLAIHEVPGILAKQDIDELRSLYRGEIAYMDRYLAHILGKLEARGLDSNTLVIFASDHGEEFFDHGRLGHGTSLHEEMLRVPLILRLKGIFPSGRRAAYDAQLTDLAPTILDLIGEKIPSGMRGQSLLPILLGAQQFHSPRALYAMNMNGFSDWIGFGRWKLIRDNAPRRADHPPYGFKLFDTDDDPKEGTDVWPSEPIVGLALRQMLLWQHRLDRAGSVVKGEDSEPAPMDPETVKRLRALGYLN